MIRTRLIMDTPGERLVYMLRINPLRGLVVDVLDDPALDRLRHVSQQSGTALGSTLKKDDNKLLVRDRVAQGTWAMPRSSDSSARLPPITPAGVATAGPPLSPAVVLETKRRAIEMLELETRITALEKERIK